MQTGYVHPCISKIVLPIFGDTNHVSKGTLLQLFNVAFGRLHRNDVYRSERQVWVVYRKTSFFTAF